jgi:serine protease Do
MSIQPPSSQPGAPRPWRRRLLPLAALALGLALGGGLTLAARSTPLDAMSPAPAPAPAATPAPSPEVTRGRNLANELSEAFEQASGVVSPSVVAIFAEQPGPAMGAFGFPDDPFRQFFGDDFFHRFFPQGPPSAQRGGRAPVIRSMGSGVIVSSDGLVLTNNHVVAGAQKLTVLLGDKRRLPAHVVGTDPPTDVAVVQIEGEKGDDLGPLPVASFGDSDRLRVGEWVIAVGNPFELLHTVTAGIVSAQGRSSMGLADYEDFIQTDASINPGNSGGALADLDGNVVGINTAISTTNGGSVGIGFAIPINMARQVMGSLVDHGKVSRGFLALVPQDVDEDLASALGLDGTQGSLVADVTAGGPADKAGIQRGDVITAFDGHPVTDSQGLRQLVAQASPGAKVEVTLLRDGHERRLNVELGERPASEEEGSQAGPGKEPGSVGKLGLEVQPLSPGIARQLGLEQGASGVVVTAVDGGSPADEAGLRSGDLIVEVDRRAVTSPAELERALARHGSGDSVALLVRRGDATFFVGIRLP